MEIAAALCMFCLLAASLSAGDAFKVDAGTKMGGLQTLLVGDIKKEIEMNLRTYESMREEDAFAEMLEVFNLVATLSMTNK